MKKVFLIVLILIAMPLLFSCNKVNDVDVVTTLFPQYDFTKQIVKDKLTVSLLTPPSVEAHDYEPTSKQLITIKNAKLFIYTSNEFDYWIKDINTINKNSLNLSISYDYEIIDNNHFWTNLIVSTQLINSILNSIIKIDKENESFYKENATDYINKLLDVHNNLKNTFKDSFHKIHFAGHNALNSFASEYNLEIESLQNTNKPDADLTSMQIITLKDKLKESNAKFLFTEELKEPKIANAIKNMLASDNYSITLLELHSYHNVTKKQFDENISYLEIFIQNCSNLKTSLL